MTLGHLFALSTTNQNTYKQPENVVFVVVFFFFFKYAALTTLLQLQDRVAICTVLRK